MKKLSIFLLVALSAGQPAWAQQGTLQNNEILAMQDGSPAKNTQAEQEFSQSPFDDSVEKLPANFIGHDPKKLYETLAEKIKEKDEFETTAAYEERIKRAATDPLFGQLVTQSAFAVSVNLGEGAKSVSMSKAAKYDADKELLQVNIFVDDGPYDASVDFADKAASLYTDVAEDKTLGTYTGENAYGAKREIVKRERWLYNILINDAKRFKIDTGDTLDSLPWLINLKFIVPMNVEIAKSAKPNLRMLVIFNLSPPYTKNETSYSEPKIDNPSEVTIHDYYVCADVKSIWLYNGITGEVYAKQYPK